MRIAYIANYQGPDLVKRRPCLNNFSLAARVKIQLIAELLQNGSHEVEILSQGAPQPLTGLDQYRLRYFPPFSESERFHPDIPVFYASALAFRFLTGIWESASAQRLLHARHRVRPFDAIIAYNLQRAPMGCTRYAVRHLDLPVLLQYEDDTFVDVQGRAWNGLRARYHHRRCRKILQTYAGGIGVSPYLMSQMPSDIPKLLLRGLVSNEVLDASQRAANPRANRVVFSGTHEGTQGLEQLVKAWGMLGLSDWELHIAGHGPLTPLLKEMAEGQNNIIFHGLLNREENARMLCTAKIGMNPQDLTRTPGNVFAFKIVEYLAAGLHVVTTPRGALESELETGITYIADNDPETIAACLKRVIVDHHWQQTAEQAAIRTYGPAAVSKALNKLLMQVTDGESKEYGPPGAAILKSAGIR